MFKKIKFMHLNHVVELLRIGLCIPLAKPVGRRGLSNGLHRPRSRGREIPLQITM